MRIEYTNRLYFGKYAYKIILFLAKDGHYDWNRYRMVKKSNELLKIITWCQDNIDSQKYKIKSRSVLTEEKVKVNNKTKKQQWVNWSVNIYAQDQHTIDQIIKQFSVYVDTIYKPLDINHENRLQVKNIIQVSPKLLFGKYNYGIYFHYDADDEIQKWLIQCYKDNPTVKISPSYCWPRVYVCDSLDLDTIQITWHHKINYVKTILLDPAAKS